MGGSFREWGEGRGGKGERASPRFLAKPRNGKREGEGCGRPNRGAHTLGDWPVVPSGEVGKGEGGDGRSRTVAREGVYACADGWCPPQRRVDIGDGSATAPNF